MKKVLLFGGLLMDRYIVTGRYPRRGEDTLIREEFQQPGAVPSTWQRPSRTWGWSR